ncbi:MAG TPA: methyltransferase domain-containing protein [Bryobacteraceae bacterium]|jgi:ubiquinone/menaquinone biosynthesis C-methylase UbiE|nr:methyltransferase domain-containing protein [Bryobacteraceae bacterium]
MRKRLFNWYWWLERRIHPGLRYSQVHYHDLLDARIPKNCDWLDLGCGHQMFASWMKKEEHELAARSRRLVGIDRDLGGLKENVVIHDAVYGDIGALPFESGSFDVVTANMVIEHLEDPGTVLGEVRRVLRPGGLFIFHTPNCRSLVMTMARMIPQSAKIWLARVLEEREEKDVFPTHYAMNTAGSISEHARSSGFAVQEIRSVSTSATTALITPLCIIELVYLRMLERPVFAGLRSNLIATLERAEPADH